MPPFRPRKVRYTPSYKRMRQTMTARDALQSAAAPKRNRYTLPSGGRGNPQAKARNKKWVEPITQVRWKIPSWLNRMRDVYAYEGGGPGAMAISVLSAPNPQLYEQYPFMKGAYQRSAEVYSASRRRGRQGAGSRAYQYAAENDVWGDYSQRLQYKKSQAAARRAAGGGRQFGEAANPYSSTYNRGFIEGPYQPPAQDYYGGGGGGYYPPYRGGGGGGGGGGRSYGYPGYMSGASSAPTYRRQPMVTPMPRWMANLANWRLGE